MVLYFSWFQTAILNLDLEMDQRKQLEQELEYVSITAEEKKEVIYIYSFIR